MATVIIKRPAAVTRTVIGGPNGHPYNPTSVAPSTGSSGGGTPITITGTNFTTATGVTLGGLPCTAFALVGPTSITCTTPAGVLGAAALLIVGPSGCNPRSDLYTFTGAAPTIASLNFSLGDTRGGGQSIVATGTNLTVATAVTIGGNSATITGNTSTTVTFTLPAHASGAVTVTVTTPGGTSGTLPFTYWNPTLITGIDSYFDSELGVTGASPVTAWADQGAAAMNLTASGSPTQVAGTFGTVKGITVASAGPNNFFAGSARSFASGLSWYGVLKTTDARTGNPGAGYAGDPPNPLFGDYFASVQDEFGTGGTSGAQALWNVYSGAAWSYNGSTGITANDGSPHMIGVTSTSVGAFTFYGGNTASGTGTAASGTTPTWSCVGRGQDAVTDTANMTIGALVTVQGVIGTTDRGNLWAWAQQRFGAT